VFDADEGGDTGVDRALQIFVGQEVDLAIATLPAGMDPCDLLVKEGPEPFLQALNGAIDALDFKLNRVLAREAAAGIEGQRRAVDAVLGVVALAPELPGQDGAVKQELIVNRIARRLALREETVWARLRELRQRRRSPPRLAGSAAESERKAPAAPREKQLLRVLLAEPRLVGVAAAEVAPAEIEHPGLRHLLEGLYALHAEGRVPDLDGLRARIDNPALAQTALDLQEVGLRHPDRAAWLQGLLTEFRRRRALPEMQHLQSRLHAAADHTEAVELLRRLQERTESLEPGAPAGEPGS
jgi:DNA primase